ncbi:MAG: UDP-glucose:(heptosyl)LPS alpha-1,3-glucosyltransferase, partial [Planctomycetota bacterium]
MQIALVHMRHAHSGGTERYLNLLSAHLAESGHRVTVICRTHEEPSHADIQFVVLKQATLGSASRMWRFAKAAERYLQKNPFDVVFGLGRTWTHDVVRLGGGCHQTYFELAHAATQSPVERLFRKGHLKHKWALEIERRAYAPSPDRIGGARPVIIANSDLVQRDV